MNSLEVHGRYFDACRVCRLQPRGNRHIKFRHIFGPNEGRLLLPKQLWKLLRIKVEPDDNKPKLICDNCYKSVYNWYSLKRKGAQSDNIFRNYIHFHGVSDTVNLPGLSITSITSLASNTSNQIITISDDEDIEDEERNDSNNEHINKEKEMLYYCSICKKIKILNHDCSQYSKSFFTCLVPNCNILSRSKKDFQPHYQLHIGMSSAATLCYCCFQEIEYSNMVNGRHICYHTYKNIFKCYTCNKVFNSMQEFAFHKLKNHNGRLMDSNGNYLCLHCEESSPELSTIIEHTKGCVENQQKNVNADGIKPENPQ